MTFEKEIISHWYENYYYPYWRKNSDLADDIELIYTFYCHSCLKINKLTYIDRDDFTNHCYICNNFLCRYCDKEYSIIVKRELCRKCYDKIENKNMNIEN